MSFKFFLHKIDLLNFFISIALILLVIGHLHFGYEALKIRKKVLDGLERSNIAKQLVIDNLINGKSLSDGWVNSLIGTDEVIDIHPNTGIISLTFPANIDGGGKTLILIPIYQFQNGNYFLDKVNSNELLQPSRIVWICTSKHMTSRQIFIKENLGSLNSKYAPTECRFSHL